LTVSFVIPHRENLALLQAAIRSIENLSRPNDCTIRVIVVDNDSTESASDWAKSAGHTAIRLSTNEGFGRAVNRGLDEGHGDFVVVINDDVELAPTWLLEMLQALETTTTAWFACGKTLQFASRSVIDGAGDAVCRGGSSWRIGHGRIDGVLFDEPRETFFPSGTATIFRCGFFDRVGQFDEEFFAYLEDVDLGLRAAAAGCGGIYVPAATAFHHGSRTGQAWSAAMVRWITAHQILLLAKHYRASLLLRFGWNIFVSQALWAALTASRGRTVAWVQGMASGLSRAPRSRRKARLRRDKSSRLPRVLATSETEIARFQRSDDADRYWKWYFRLVGWPAGDGR
jgi:GT2 family glycosyltransferase